MINKVLYHYSLDHVLLNFFCLIMLAVVVRCSSVWKACPGGICLKLVKTPLKFLEAKDNCDKKYNVTLHIPTNPANDNCTKKLVKKYNKSDALFIPALNEYLQILCCIINLPVYNCHSILFCSDLK